MVFVVFVVFVVCTVCVRRVDGPCMDESCAPCAPVTLAWRRPRAAGCHRDTGPPNAFWLVSASERARWVIKGAATAQASEPNGARRAVGGLCVYSIVV